MKTEKIFAFPIDNPLTDDKRRIIEVCIEKAAAKSGMPLGFSWSADNADLLCISAGPVAIEVLFHAREVELLAAVPMWARMLFTDARKAELKDMIEKVIVVAGLRGQTTPA